MIATSAVIVNGIFGYVAKNTKEVVAMEDMESIQNFMDRN